MTTYDTPHTITVPGTQTTVDDLDKLDIAFESDEQAAKPITEEARLWWFNGLPTDADMMATGWHIRAEVNPYIDETMAGMNMRRYLVQHKRPDKNGSTAPKPYWRLHTCSLIVIARRVQSFLEMVKSPAERYGVAFGKETVHNDKGEVVMQKKHDRPKQQSVLRLRAYVHELVRHGYSEWLPVTLSGYITDSMLAALAEQYRVLDAYSAYREGQGKSTVAPYFLFSLPVGPGAMKLVGEPPDQGTIYPIMAQTPQTIDKTYLAQHLVPQDLLDHIRHEVLMDTIQWSIEESVKIAGGSAQTVLTLAAPTGTTSANGPQALASAAADTDPFVIQAQLNWILQNYCGNNAEVAAATCARFGVPELNQLRKSHFNQLVSERSAKR